MTHMRTLMSMLCILTTAHASQDLWSNINTSPVVDLSQETLPAQEYDKVYVVLAQRFKQKEPITSLNLSGHKFDPAPFQDNAAEKLATFPMVQLLKSMKQAPNLEYLNMSGCLSENITLNHRMAWMVATALEENPTLRALNLSHNHMHMDAFGSILDYIPSIPTLEELNLSHNPIQSAVFRLEDYLKNAPALKKMDLSYTGLESTDISTSIINSIIENPTLQTLRLAGNPLGRYGSTTITYILSHSSTLRVLDVSNCQLTNDSLRSFAMLAAHKKFVTNDFNQDSIPRTLYLGGHDFTEEAKREFEDAFSQAFSGTIIKYETSPDTVARMPYLTSPAININRPRKNSGMSLSRSMPDIHYSDTFPGKRSPENVGSGSLSDETTEELTDESEEDHLHDNMRISER